MGHHPTDDNDYKEMRLRHDNLVGELKLQIVIIHRKNMYMSGYGLN